MSNSNDVKSFGRLNYVEPTNFFEKKDGTYSDSINYPYENYSIAVDLTISQVDRYSCGWWTNDGGRKDINFSSSNGTLSFLGGSKVGEDKYLTTNYTDISMTNPETNTSECLGIESINISYNSWLYPQVVIKFVDVRGATVMQPSERAYYNSKDAGNSSAIYRALFSFPYPMFILKVKGFYGRGVTYRLTVEKTNFEFDASTGNFNITASFIGYMYGVYSDMPITFLALAPYMESGKEYWKSKIESGDFKFVGGEGGPMCTIPELRLKLANVANNEEAKKISGESVKTSEESDKRAALLTAIQDDFPFTDWTKVKDNTNIYKAFSISIDKVPGGFKEFCENFYTYVELVASYDKVYGTNHMSYITPMKNIYDKMVDMKKDDSKKETFYEAFPHIRVVNDNGVSAYDNDKQSLFNQHKVGINEALLKIKENSNDFIVAYIDTAGGTYFDPAAMEKYIKEELKSVNEKKDELIKEYKEKEASVVEKVLGFRPSIKNIYDLMFAHMDTFLHCFYSSTKKIKDQLESDKEKRAKTRYEINDGYSDTEDAGSNSSGVIDNRGKYLPPYAAIYKDDNTEGQNKKVFMWPGDLKNGNDLEEVKFVKDMLSGAELYSEESESVDKIIENMSKQEEGVKSETYPPNVPSLHINKFIPVTTFDFILKDKMENPYIKFSNKVKDSVDKDKLNDLITIFLFRAFYYFSTSDMNYTSRGSGKGDNLFGMIEAVNVFKAVKDNYSESFKEFLKKWLDGKNEKNAEDILESAIGDGSEKNDMVDALLKSWEGGNSDIFAKKPFKVDYDGYDEIDYTYHTGIKVDGTTHKMFPLYFNSIEDLHAMFNGGDLLKNEFLLPTKYYDKLYKDENNASTFVLWETGNYLNKLYELVETEIKETSVKTYGNRKGSEFGITVDNLDLILEGIREESGEVFEENFDVDKPYKIYRKISGEEIAIDDIVKNLDNQQFIDGVYIKYPTVVSEMFTLEAYKKYDMKKRALLFLLHSNCINMFDRGYENRNRVDLKCRILREGACYWAVEGLEANDSYYTKVKEEVGKYESSGLTLSRRRTIKKYFEDWATSNDEYGFATNIDLYGDINLYGRDLSEDGKKNGGYKVDDDPGDVEQLVLENKEDDKVIYSDKRNHNNGLDIVFLIGQSETENSKKAAKLQSFLRNLFFTKVTTIDMFNGFNLNEDTKFTMKPYKASVCNALYYFLDTLRKIYEEPLDDIAENEKAFEQTVSEAKANNPFNTTDIKLSTYMTLKNLYDKWLSSPYYGPEKTWVLTRKPDSKSDFDNFKYADTFYNDIGNILLANVSKVSQWVSQCMPTSNMNTIEGMNGRVGNTLYEYLAAIAQDCGGMLMALPQKFGLSKPSDVKDMFTPFATSDKWDEDSSTYVFMYTYKPSEHLGDENTAHIDMNGWSPKGDGLDLDDYELLGKSFSNTNGFSVPAFAVTYAKQNQSIFKNIQLNSETHGATEAGIAATMNIAAKSSESVRESTLYGQDLYKVFSNYSFNCNVETMGNTQILPLMYFQLNNVPYWRGAYMIKKVTHSITAGNMSTNFEGIRVNRYAIPMSDGAIAIHKFDGGPTATDGTPNTQSTSNSTIGGKVTGNGDIKGDMNLKVPDPIDFDESNVTEMKPIICVTPAHGPLKKATEWKWSSKVVDRMVEILKTYKYNDGTPYNVQRCNKNGNHAQYGGYSMVETKNLIRKFGSRKVISVVPHWNGDGGKRWCALKRGSCEYTREDSIKLMEIICECAKEVKANKDAYTTMPIGGMDGGCTLEHQDPYNPKTKKTECESSDGAVMLNCACALTENWFANYPLGKPWNTNGWDILDATGRYPAMRGWMEQTGNTGGIEVIAQLNVNGIKRYIDYINTNGLVPISAPDAVVTGGGGGSSCDGITLDQAISDGTLVELNSYTGENATYAKHIIVKNRYATNDNIMGTNVYKDNPKLTVDKAYLTPKTIEALCKAQKYLEEHYGTGATKYAIVIWDAVRPDSIQKACYENPDPRTKKGGVANGESLFLAQCGGRNPSGKISKGSTHSFGTAVDVSIMEFKPGANYMAKQGGVYIDVGKGPKSIDGGMDDNSEFGVKNPPKKLLTTVQRNNRKMLYDIMENENGGNFKPITPEWWHFELKNARSGKLIL